MRFRYIAVLTFLVSGGCTVVLPPPEKNVAIPSSLARLMKEDDESQLPGQVTTAVANVPQKSTVPPASPTELQLPAMGNHRTDWRETVPYFRPTEQAYRIYQLRKNPDELGDYLCRSLISSMAPERYVVWFDSKTWSDPVAFSMAIATLTRDNIWLQAVGMAGDFTVAGLTATPVTMGMNRMLTEKGVAAVDAVVHDRKNDGGKKSSPTPVMADY